MPEATFIEKLFEYGLLGTFCVFFVVLWRQEKKERDDLRKEKNEIIYKLQNDIVVLEEKRIDEQVKHTEKLMQMSQQMIDATRTLSETVSSIIQITTGRKNGK